MLCRNDLEDDIAAYIKDRVPKARMYTVFDVGANHGWFTYQFGKTFRDARFFLFEPSPPIFAAIEGNLRRFAEYNLWPRVRAFPLAMGDAAGRAHITIEPDVTVNRIVTTQGQPTAEVEIVAGDSFCAAHRIDRIDFLKIDAEGYDMKVLRGFRTMLKAGRIAFVQVEASLSPDNTEHVALAAFARYLAAHRYRMFRVINQASGRLPYVTRADVVFIHEAAAAALAD